MDVTIINPIPVTPDLTPRALLKPSVPSLIDSGARLREINIVEFGAAIAMQGHQVTVVVAGPYLRGENVALSSALTLASVDTVLHVPFHPGLLPLMPGLANHPAVTEADVVQVGEFHQPSTFFAARGG